MHHNNNLFTWHRVVDEENKSKLWWKRRMRRCKCSLTIDWSLIAIVRVALSTCTNIIYGWYLLLQWWWGIGFYFRFWLPLHSLTLYNNIVDVFYCFHEVMDCTSLVIWNNLLDEVRFWFYEDVWGYFIVES